MPIFDYKGFAPDGTAKKGYIEADNAKNARLKLKKQRLIVSDIKERSNKKSSSISFLTGSVGGQEISLMTRQLASLIKANIPLVEALTAMVDQTENENMRSILAQIRQEVNEGSSLAKTLAKHPKVFDYIYTNMVEAGENSGTLGLVLLKLADLKEAQMRLKNKIVSGMTYPVLMLFVGFTMVLLIFTFVIPKLTKVFESANKELPGSTQFLIQVSDIFVNYWYLVIAGMIGFIYLFLKYIQTAHGLSKWDRFKLKAPIFGKLTQMIAITRFTSTMSTLLGSSVPILTSMKISKNLVGNVHIAKAIDTARENITEGQSIAEPLKRSGEFPPLVIHMIAIGERTGELSNMLNTISKSYEEQVSAKIDGLTALMEPLMIIGMGLMVGGIVYAIFIPLLEISNVN